MSGEVAPSGKKEQSFFEDHMLDRMVGEGIALAPNAKEVAAAACKIYRNLAYHPMAMGIALAHKWGLQLLEQAPILALAPNRGNGLRLSELGTYPVAAHIGKAFAKRLDRGDKLAAMLAEYHLPPQYRALSGFALSPTRWDVLWQIREMNRSTLAQIIPAAKYKQNNWLYALGQWRRHIYRNRHGVASGIGPDVVQRAVEWGAVALSAVAEPNLELTSAGDFVIARYGRFNWDWTWAQANEGAEQWHRELATLEGEKEFVKKTGIDWNDKINYSPFPVQLEVDGFQFVALDTPAELFLEGRIMHHCVAAYTQPVILGSSRIFSIRKGPRRVATLELIRVYAGGSRTTPSNVPIADGRAGLADRAKLHSRWQPTQLNGPCNARVSKDVRSASANWMRAVANRAGGEASTEVHGMDTDGIRSAILAAAQPDLREE